MSNFDYFKQYKSEMERIDKLMEEEENPYHRAHIKQFSDMMDEKIRTQVPPLIQQQQEAQRVDVQTYLNGKRIKDGDLGRAMKDYVLDSLKKALGKHR